ncbi:MAG: DUF6285 domain-containing protein [Porticoccaceae bacterium]
MPQDRGTAGELLAGVEAFLRIEVLPQLSGGSIYKCRVAANILGILQREVALGEPADAAELGRLEALLGRKSPAAHVASALDDLNAGLCAGIRSGALDSQRAAIFTHVKHTVQDKLRIANPRYPGLMESLGE